MSWNFMLIFKLHVLNRHFYFVEDPSPGSKVLPSKIPATWMAFFTEQFLPTPLGSRQTLYPMTRFPICSISVFLYVWICVWETKTLITKSFETY